jgi:hypothetical protein
MSRMEKQGGVLGDIAPGQDAAASHYPSPATPHLQISTSQQLRVGSQGERIECATCTGEAACGEDEALGRGNAGGAWDEHNLACEGGGGSRCPGVGESFCRGGVSVGERWWAEHGTLHTRKVWGTHRESRRTHPIHLFLQQ